MSPIGTRVRAGVVMVWLGAAGVVSAQTERPIRDRDGIVACLIVPPSIRTAAVLNDDRVRVDLRAPASPPEDVAARLAAPDRDFSTRPIEVFLIPSAGVADAELKTPRRITPLAIEQTLVRPTIDGKQSADAFVRVSYPRDVLQPGIDIVAERTAVATNGEKVTSQTRCRITDADAAYWR